MRALSPADRTWGVFGRCRWHWQSSIAVEAHIAPRGGLLRCVYLCSAEREFEPSGLREQTPAARTLARFSSETAVCWDNWHC